MTTFNPTEHEPAPRDPNARGKWLSTAGLFLAVFTSLRQRGRTRSGKQFLLMRGEVLRGKPPGQEGKTFTQRLFINEEAWRRLGALMSAMDSHDVFDLTNDSACRAALLGRPFLAKFKVESYDGSDYAKIAYSEPLDSWTDDDNAAADRWVEAANDRGFYDKLAGRADPGREEAPPPGDDDIPF